MEEEMGRASTAEKNMQSASKQRIGEDSRETYTATYSSQLHPRISAGFLRWFEELS